MEREKLLNEKNELFASYSKELDILIINSHLPIFPGGGGVEYLTTYHIAAEANKIGLVSMAHSRDDLNKALTLQDAGVKFYLWESPFLDAEHTNNPSKYPNIIRKAHNFFQILTNEIKTWPNKPADTILLDLGFRNMSSSIVTALSEKPWQVLSVIESSAASFIDYIPSQMTSILVMHDIRSLIYARRAQTTNNIFEKAWLSAQAKRYFHFEKTYSQRYDLVTTVSISDAEWVRKNYNPKNVITVPLPVDTNYFKPSNDSKEEHNRIVFTGLMNHPPNFDAAIYFAKEVFPLIKKHHPNAEFYIVGRHPVQDVLDLNDIDDVYVTGGVPDIRPYLTSASVVVVPLRYGSGARQKILEAWSMEKTVVSTSVGAEGLAYTSGENILIADTTQALADSVSQVLENESLREKLRFSGRALVQEQHNPQQIAKNYYQEIKRVTMEKMAKKSPMRVAIDMRWMIPGVAGGIETVARSFMEHLLELDYYNQYTAILPTKCLYDFDIRAHSNFKLLSIDSFSSHAKRFFTKLSRKVHSALRFDYWKSPDVEKLEFARSLQADIAYSFPGYIYPDVYPLHQVVMVPDIQHEFFPEFFPNGALEERRKLYGEAIRRAEHICAISEFTKQTLVDKLNVDPNKITAIPLAAEPIFTTDEDVAFDRKVLSHYGLNGDYFFLPGHTWHHKNHITALKALNILREKYGIEIKLVLTGGAREAHPAIEEYIAQNNLQDQVVPLGYVLREHLPVLYRHAKALIFPSLFEGFGMPVLEAMSSGCPVICSNTTSLPEIAGSAALLIDPQDAEGFAEAMYSVLMNDELVQTLKSEGLVQASKFSWKRHTLETLVVLYNVHQRIYGMGI